MRQTCEECGSFPVGHMAAYVNTTTEVLLAPLNLDIFYTLAGAGLWTLFKFVQLLHLVSYNDNPEKILTERSRVIWEEAKRRDLSIRQIMIAGMPTEHFEVESGRRFVFQSLPLPFHSFNTFADDKHTLTLQLQAAGIPTPRSYSTTTLAQARRALKELGLVCVKPRLGSNGRHTFPYVSSEKALSYAFSSAQKLCRYVVIEEHLEGNLARATCVDGKLVGFLECIPPYVVGDGRLNVQELVEEANAMKPPQAKDIEITPVHEKYISRRGYKLSSVLEAGKRLPLGYWAGFTSGGSSKEYGADINPELRFEIERAARATKLAVVGFDLIIENPHKSSREQRWGIIEANSMPFIDLHYGGTNEQNVAGKIWDMWARAH